MTTRAAIATPETDAALCKRFRKLGNRARRNDAAREDCPYNGMIKFWWLEGWDGLHGEIQPADAPTGDDRS